MKNLILISLTFFFSYKIFSQNVGIGTLTPADKLSVVNAMPGYGFTHTYGPVTVGSWISNLNGQFGTKTNHPLQFFTNNGDAQITLLQDGNVGIGNLSPLYKLDILHDGGTDGIRVKSTVGGAGITIDGFSGLADLRFSNNGAKKWDIYNDSNTNSLVFYQTGATDEVRMFFDRTSGNVGFKSLSPQTDIHINPNGPGSILIGTNRNSGGYTNLEMGITAQSDGHGYIQATKAAGSEWGTLQLNPSGGDVTVAGSVGIGTNTPNFPLDIIQPDNIETQVIRILSSGHIWGMGNQKNSGAFTFIHNGHFRADIDKDDGSYNTYSDKRLKKNIEELSPILDKVLQLKAKKYQFIDAEDTNKKSTGFISQEVVDLFPELVSSSKRSAEDPTLYLGLNYAGFSVVAIKAIQEQQIIIDELKKRIESLENKK